ncbi:AtpZ/AtpI family protein [Candidatus Uhrbacteria bacterium UHB]|uniref:AtpZ/AtpI family protein n=1 Tax=candidate division WWE3 bacterium TaxID=2053526 RepID=A0A928TTV8_UNCKA|nr:AtpZ/AtpI family protein [candidate division WWE3 bacterium]MDL1953179.1 AtpZ/AtpI family protein [Candidatus Uhrbacteria bacterium UHB]
MLSSERHLAFLPNFRFSAVTDGLDFFNNQPYTPRVIFMENRTERKKDIGYGEALGMVWDVLITLLVSTFLFALGGRWLDVRYGTGWVFTVSGFVLLILVGWRIIHKKGASIAKRMDETGAKKKPEETQ